MPPNSWMLPTGCPCEPKTRRGDPHCQISASAVPAERAHCQISASAVPAERAHRHISASAVPAERAHRQISASAVPAERAHRRMRAGRRSDLRALRTERTDSRLVCELSYEPFRGGRGGPRTAPLLALID
eukprot:798327-Prorocentrum_minimum.AAC.2